MFPNIENIKGRGVIAMSHEQSEEITKVWQKHEDLIVNAIMAKVNDEGSTSFWKLDKCYYNAFPREEIKKRLNSCNALEGTARNPTIKTLLPLANKNGINITEIRPMEDVNELGLLSRFYDENAYFLLALISSIGDTDRKNVECFLYYMRSTSRKGRKKYSIYIGEELHGKPYLNNWETVFELMKIWVKENKDLFNDLNSAEIVEKLNKEIPLKENSYYKKGKFLKHLFYEYKESGYYHYDGSSVEGMDPEETKITNWDMYPAGQGHYFSINNTRVTMAKMWRTPDVENFIKYMTKRLGKDFGLSVETFS